MSHLSIYKKESDSSHKSLKSIFDIIIYQFKNRAPLYRTYITNVTEVVS